MKIPLEISIFYRTQKTFETLDEQYEDDMKVRILLILSLYGGFSFLYEHFRGIENSEFFTRPFAEFIIIGMLGFLVSGLIKYLFAYYLLSYMLFGIGKLLKGQAELIDIRIVVAYSMIPFFVNIFYNTVFFVLRQADISYPYFKWLDFAILVVLYFLSLRILFIGIKQFNTYGNLRAIINVIPFIIIYAGIILLYLLHYLGMF